VILRLAGLGVAGRIEQIFIQLVLAGLSGMQQPGSGEKKKGEDKFFHWVSSFWNER
jgi:hypothetical protein